MKPDLRENSIFLRYNEIWRNNPSSVVFAPLAEILILHKCYEEAIEVCKEGLEKNPELISGRVAFAKAYVGVLNYKRALEEASVVLKKYPDHPEALEIQAVSKRHIEADLAASAVSERFSVVPIRPSFRQDGQFVPGSLDPTNDNRWNTVTMAEIFARQGNLSEAKKIYDSILTRDPDNISALKGLQRLVTTGD